ncbi:MAG: tRNA-binding protein [Candidatus Bathyarchaeia archaeon]
MSLVSYEDFKKMDMRVVQVMSADPVPGKTKILRLEVDIGGGVKKTIVAGGAQFYRPQDFIGKKFIAIVNLEPRTVAGIASEGMLLATNTDKPIWLTVDPSAPVGSRIV